MKKRAIIKIDYHIPNGGTTEIAKKHERLSQFLKVISEMDSQIIGQSMNIVDVEDETKKNVTKLKFQSKP